MFLRASVISACKSGKKPKVEQRLLKVLQFVFRKLVNVIMCSTSHLYNAVHLHNVRLM